MTNDDFAALREQLVTHLPAEHRPAPDDELSVLLTRCDRAADQGVWLVKATGSHRRPTANGKVVAVV
jgi:hypothetical protein